MKFFVLAVAATQTESSSAATGRVTVTVTMKTSRGCGGGISHGGIRHKKLRLCAKAKVGVSHFCGWDGNWSLDRVVQSTIEVSMYTCSAPSLARCHWPS